MDRIKLASSFLLVVSALGCGGDDSVVPEPRHEAQASENFLVDQTSEVGLDFVHDNGRSGKLYIAEAIGSGGALLDADGDGDLDLFFVQGAPLGASGESDQRFSDRLYRNELIPEGTLRFVDATDESGLLDVEPGYGMGAAVGDFDGDGRPDLYVTRFGSDRLLRNLSENGEIRFVDATEEAGLGEPSWGVSALFVDFDQDRRLDLFVGDYVDFRIAAHKTCLGPNGAVDYCGPTAYADLPDRLYRNLGDGRFENVAEEAGLNEFGAALGAVSRDFDGDGVPDLYVANDASANQLWRGRGDGTFENVALLAGCALNSTGQPEAGMGTAAGDVDGDGDQDLIVAHLTQETNTLYVNDGAGFFSDATLESGLGAPSWPMTGFGIGFFDLENDGDLDLYVADGAVRIIPALAAAGDPHPLGQSDQLFRNLGDGRFEDLSPQAGEIFHRTEVGRGVALGDLDNDGDTDLVVINNHGPARVLLNVAADDARWIGLRLLDEQGADALGARVEIDVGERTLHRTVHVDGSYASSSDPRVIAGLGASARVDEVRVLWPDGSSESRTDLPIDQYVVWRQGEEP